MTSSLAFAFSNRDGVFTPQKRTRSASVLDDSKGLPTLDLHLLEQSTHSSPGVKRDLENGIPRPIDIQLESQPDRDTRWPSREHLRRSSSASSGLFNLPLLGTSCVGRMLLWTSLILGLMVSLSFLFPAR
ncbi:hypothetical protein WJX75_002179 [Coccomyxa subellipsoidea]|uniref:Uncharacterized protein n=1 Tax=Coccomyxa subellipsoidea TaxID=248742 RepID=A0ABR2YRP7_9CHLO